MSENIYGSHIPGVLKPLQGDYQSITQDIPLMMKRSTDISMEENNTV
jgi:hypothetical protein